MIKLYLKMKNAKAEGIYDISKDTITILKGAIFESEIVDSFKTHHYIKLRQETINSDYVDDYVLLKDLEFSSLSAAAAILGGRAANGRTLWRTENGMTAERYLELEDNRRSFSRFYYDNIDIEDNLRYKEIIEEFKGKFPLESILEMKLENYDFDGHKDTFTYYIEHKTKPISGGSFRKKRHKIFFHKNGEYENQNRVSDLYPKLSVEERFEIYKEDLYNYISDFDETTYVSIDYRIFLTNYNYLRSKLINIYHPNILINIDSRTILYKICKYFGIEKEDGDSVELNLHLKRYIYKLISDSKDMSLTKLSNIIWKFYVDVINLEESIDPSAGKRQEDDQSDDIEDIPRTSKLFLSKEKVEDILYLLENKKNIILQGPPGVGKTFSIKKIIKENFDNVESKEQIKFVQFHQSYSYEEFVEGWKPNNDNTYGSSKGIFLSYIDDFVKINPSKKYFLVIDEINRGNLSKIFGELLLLIEKDKRSNLSVQLPYSNKEFTIPSNLYIIGTMNTADRSLALIDYALRRRFAFITLKPLFGSENFNEHLKNAGLDSNQITRLNEIMIKLNNNLRKDLGENFEIGHSYFVPEKDIDDFDLWFNNIRKYEIIPLLEEYYFDNPDKVEEYKEKLEL